MKPGPHDARIAVIGAGMSGLTCASELASRSLDVHVFEKSRGAGGRMSTRRVDALGDGADFDHGAQYFTARDPRFQKRVEAWLDDGVVAIWSGRVATLGADRPRSSSGDTQRFVGTPGMNAVCRRLARGLSLRFGARVERIVRRGDAWTLRDIDGETLGNFDVVLCSAPAPQTRALLGAVAPDLATQAGRAQMQPCWAVLAAFDERLPLELDAAFVNEGPLSWVAKSSSKPGRSPMPERWVLHASPAWSKAHLTEAPYGVITALIEALAAATDVSVPAPAWSTAHRWRYALSDSPLQDGCLYDAKTRIGACGDWANGNRVEGAFLSGLALARAVAGEFALDDQS